MITSPPCKLVDELFSEIETINIVFYQSLGEKVDVIRVDTHTVANLASACTTQADFFMKISFLYKTLRDHLCANCWQQILS
jgi:hypothetical protein